MIYNQNIYYYTSKTATDKGKYTSTFYNQVDIKNDYYITSVVKNGIRLIITGSKITISNTGTLS